MLAERAARESPDDPRVHSALGLIYAELDRKDEAIRAGERAVELYPVSKDALLGPMRIWDLALIYARIGEFDAALKQLEYLLSIQSSYSVSFFNLSPTLVTLHQLPGYERLVRLYEE
jgi:tetratricopeptide (TPR) repeat protein